MRGPAELFEGSKEPADRRGRDFGARWVLVFGAGVAGLTLAYWLSRFGFVPTVVERRESRRFDAAGHAVDHVELMRGDLVGLLHDAGRNEVDQVFDDSVTSLVDDGAELEVSFRRARSRTFDLVVGADGLHSTTCATPWCLIRRLRCGRWRRPSACYPGCPDPSGAE